jgi:hypothetical protein
MYRNTTVESLPLGLSRRLLAKGFASLSICLMAVVGLTLFGGLSLMAQSTSGGGITGTISDPSGAAVKLAKITATNTETGVATTQTSGTSGNYSIAPLAVGTYNVEVVAKGFQRVLQENINVDNASMYGLNIKLTVGGENTTITVTDAPPPLDTTDATLGGTVENELYSELPLSMNGNPRDPTAFQYLMPGVQENPANNGIDSEGNATNTTSGASGIYGGSGATGLNENYVNGVPVTNIASQGSGVPVTNAVSVDSVDQFSVQTSGASTSFGGAGVTNYTIKSGGNQYHGGVFDFIRNTMFDTWGYLKTPNPATGTEVKPGEHQNSYGGSLSGPILKDKLFFFFNYEGYAYTKVTNTPQFLSIPTILERTGDFTDVSGNVNAAIGDPTNPSRPPVYGTNANGIPSFNVLDPTTISPISQYLQSALPQPTSLAVSSNYLTGLPLENRDYNVNLNLNYTLNSRNSFTLTALGGNVGYGGQPKYSTNYQIAVPYAGGVFINQKSASGVFSYNYVASQTLINSLKYGYTRTWGEQFSLTENKTNSLMPATTNSSCDPQYPTANENACAAGITNLPAGNATMSMPAITFSEGIGPIQPSNWNANPDSGPLATNSFTAIDNLQWMKGRHNVTFGLQVQWLETNGGSFSGFSNVLALTYSSYSTELATTGTSGDAYASYLIGALYTGNVKTQSIVDVGARYRPIAPYVQDNWQVSPKLTLNLGLRYDYLQPYHEVQDRISFLNSKIINPIVGIPGVLEYAGFPNSDTPAAYAPYICHCTTPVKPYNKNFEPRVGFSYAYSQSTVFSGAFGIQLTHSGGTGGGNGATQGTSNSGEYGITSTFAAPSASNGMPSFFLNPLHTGQTRNATYYPGAAIPQGSQYTGFSATASASTAPIPCVVAGTCSPFSAIPPWLIPGTNVNPLASTGNYQFVDTITNPELGGVNLYNCQTSDNTSCQNGAINFADPYYGGRGPQFVNYNFAVQKMINKKAVLSIAYSGSQTHFLPGGTGRGPATNGISPDYAMLLQGNLTASTAASVGTMSEVQAVQALLPSYKLPYPGFSGSTATVSQSLKAFPQFGSLTDVWGETGNSNYNSLQIKVTQRPWHNLSGFVNYTRSKEIDDLGHHRTQYALGPENGNFSQYIPMREVDRGLGTANQTNAFNAAWVYNLPIGRGQAFGSTSRLATLIGGNWQLSGIYKYRDGYPLQITNGKGCEAATAGLQGTCEPDYTPGFNKKNARINGRWGRGAGATPSTMGKIQYLNPNAFQCPDSNPTNIYATCGTSGVQYTWKIGNIARSGADGLTGPGWWDVDFGIRRTFNVRQTPTLHLTFQFEADASNVTNSTFFNLAGVAWGKSNYGQVNGQNASVQPRDWQVAGRFRF